VLKGSRLRLFAGAGMVGVPDAQREWMETHLKMRPWLQLLGIEHGMVERALV
jgi:isochorismate synthase EntC